LKKFVSRVLKKNVLWFGKISVVILLVINKSNKTR
jgi:hypothetical protein